MSPSYPENFLVHWFAASPRRPADDDDLTDWANNLDGGGGISALALASACLLASPSSLDWMRRRTAGGPATDRLRREGGGKEEEHRAAPRRQEYRSACRVPVAGSPSSPSFRSLPLLAHRAAAGSGSSTAATNCTWQRREGKKANI